MLHGEPEREPSTERHRAISKDVIPRPTANTSHRAFEAQGEGELHLEPPLEESEPQPECD